MLTRAYIYEVNSHYAVQAQSKENFKVVFNSAQRYYVYTMVGWLHVEKIKPVDIGCLTRLYTPLVTRAASFFLHHISHTEYIHSIIHVIES